MRPKEETKPDADHGTSGAVVVTDNRGGQGEATSAFDECVAALRIASRLPRGRCIVGDGGSHALNQRWKALSGRK
ncbi:MAG: hypothetical protein HW405_673 [Candidatus Berkelbacteria bacterium]|nr:hypothetical protein [Candidatus Berkelbacteria bacterium]